MAKNVGMRKFSYYYTILCLAFLSVRLYAQTKEASPEYHIVGTNEGKKIDKTVKSGGSPWVQNLAYFCSIIVPENGTLEYECFRPGSFTLNQMTAKIEKDESSSTQTCVRARPTGLAAKLFHADYFFSPKSRKLNGYKAVEGGPGTPVTTWTPAE